MVRPPELSHRFGSDRGFWYAANAAVKQGQKPAHVQTMPELLGKTLHPRQLKPRGGLEIGVSQSPADGKKM